jgi:hypothetical protein
MKRLACFFVFFCTLFAVSAGAQTVQVKGKVSDSSGAPLQGVSVAVKDTKKGTQTDAQGNYSISVTAPSGKVTLVFSSTNFRSETVTTDGKSAVNVTLQRDVAQIEDVVVIGYQTVRRCKRIKGRAYQFRRRGFERKTCRCYRNNIRGLTGCRSEGEGERWDVYH